MRWTDAKPCEVLHDGRWFPGFLLLWRRGPTGWRACVMYTTGPGCTYSHWRPAADLRPAQRSTSA